jgi:hypothetical protein
VDGCWPLGEKIVRRRWNKNPARLFAALHSGTKVAFSRRVHCIIVLPN